MTFTGRSSDVRAAAQVPECSKRSSLFVHLRPPRPRILIGPLGFVSPDVPPPQSHLAPVAAAGSGPVREQVDRAA